MTQTNIVEEVFAKSPNQYQGYTYEYTDLDTGRKYIGVHKGCVTDSYKHSSRNAEFNKIFQDSASRLKYEVLSYGTFREMLNFEHKLLKEVNAKDNPQYFNKTNGVQQYMTPDLESCREMAEMIQEKKFPITYEDKNEHADMERLQVRYQDDDKLQKLITQKLDDAGGSVDKCNPIVVFEGRGKKGGDVRIDGNHTFYGALASKHTLDIKIMRVSYQEGLHLTDLEMETVADLLNARPDIVKKPCTSQDGVKHVKGWVYHGAELRDAELVKALQMMGFTRREITTILDNAEQELTVEKEKEKNGSVFKNYKSGKYLKEMTAKTQKLMAKDNTIALYMSSAKFSLERIVDSLYANRNDEIKTVYVVIHHPSVAQEKKWKENIQPQWLKQLRFVMSQYDFNFIEMDMWDVPDED
tara:strand:+ start:88 stop:1323 length:1236 start_codon:yes stop_codon:yes gene_type:complete